MTKELWKAFFAVESTSCMGCVNSEYSIFYTCIHL